MVWRPPDAVLHEACCRLPLAAVADRLGVPLATLRSWRRSESYRAHAAEVEARAVEVMAERRAADLTAAADALLRIVRDGYEHREQIAAAKALADLHARAAPVATAPAPALPDRSDLLDRVRETISAAGPLPAAD